MPDPLAPPNSPNAGLHERWLLEWLRANAAARLLEYHDGDRFELTDVGALVLARSDSPSFAAAACGEPRPGGFVDRLAEAFRTGIGSRTTSSAGGRAPLERMLGPMARALLVPVVIPALDGVQAKLERGAIVADVGCGAGLALELLAAAFPGSTFHGYDLSEHAIDAARQRFASRAHERRAVHAPAEELPPEPAYDLVLTFDCIHDMTRPDLAIAAIRRAIKDDGTWLVKDIRSSPDFVENLRNPMLAMMYSLSVATCMSSAMSEPGGPVSERWGSTPKWSKQWLARRVHADHHARRATTPRTSTTRSAGSRGRQQNRTSCGRFLCQARAMRADRLVAVLMLLQTRGQITAAEVADELEVSERTARRDLEALSMAGVPVYSRQGRNGGWQLVGGARTDLSGLNAAEARALFLVAGPSSSATPELKAALRKLVRALPETFRSDAEAA